MNLCDPSTGKDWRQKMEVAENEVVGWHHRLNGHEFEQIPGDGDGQGSLACCSPWGHKELDTTEWLNNNDNMYNMCFKITCKWKVLGLLICNATVLKDDAVKVLHSICHQIWKTQQWPQAWKRPVFFPIPKKGNPKEWSNYHTVALISHASKVMLKILQARLQQYVNHELPDVQAGFRKHRGTRDQIANVCWIIEKAREFQKKHLFLLYWLCQSLWLCGSQ